MCNPILKRLYTTSPHKNSTISHLLNASSPLNICLLKVDQYFMSIYGFISTNTSFLYILLSKVVTSI